MRKEETVFRQHPLIDVAPEDIETSAVESGCDISVDNRIITHFQFVVALKMEGHCGRLIIKAVIRGIIIAVKTDLKFEHFEGNKLQIKVAVDCELGQREDVFVRRFLIIK